MLHPEDFFDLSQFQHKALFDYTAPVWDALKHLKDYILSTLVPTVAEVRKKGEILSKTCVLYEGNPLEHFTIIEDELRKGVPKVVANGRVVADASILYAGVCLLSDDISIGKGTIIEPGAVIKGPAIIGDYTEIRQGAYIRGNVIIGNRCLVGHTTEIKHSIMVYGSKAGHFAYIGDSILGMVNLGAGTKLANLKVFNAPIIIDIDGNRYNTGLRKLGAIIGDGVELGCNTVTNPGTILSKGVMSYPNSSLRGYYPPGVIVKVRQEQELIKKA